MKTCTDNMKMKKITGIVVCMALAARVARAEEVAKSLLAASELRAAGACVILGARDGKLAAGVAKEGKWLVQALAPDAAALARVRKDLDASGVYGQASASLLILSRLPYADNLANLVVVVDPAAVKAARLSDEELLRVVAPDGALMTAEGGGWKKTAKPRPAGMDEWTQEHYSAQRTRSSQDTLVERPSGFRWLAGPNYPVGAKCGSVYCVVLAGGRMLSITVDVADNFDRPVERFRVYLLARDVFNGLVLWKRPFEGMLWFDARLGKSAGGGDRMSEAFSTKYDQQWPKPAIGGQMQHAKPMPLVARGDKAYTCENEAVIQVDTATGTTLRKSDALDSIPDNLILSEGILYCTTSGRLYAHDAETLAEKWKVDVQAMNPTAGGNLLFYLDTGKRPYDIVACDAKTGKERWRTAAGSFYLTEERATKGKLLGQREQFVERFLLNPEKQEGYMQLEIRLYADLGEKAPARGPRGILVIGSAADLHGLSPEDGKILWTAEAGQGPKQQLAHAFFVEGRLYTGSYIVREIDPLTGKIIRDNVCHLSYRCQRCAATSRYFTEGRDLGCFAVDGKAENAGAYRFYGSRGSCWIGVIPANGLLYNFPQSCPCRAENVRGYQGLEGKPKTEVPPLPDAQRLVKGPAFNQGDAGHVTTKPGPEWPTFQADFRRSGNSPQSLPADLEKLWQAKVAEPVQGLFADDWNAGDMLADPLTAPTVAGGMVFTALPHRHQVVAFDVRDGKAAWTFTAGARMDGSPTIYDGYCLFGCKDGWIYCLLAKDGELAWRFQAAPRDERMVAYGQFESKWPVAGSVLVVDGIAYAAVGRHSSADGGVFVYALNVRDGAVLWKQHVASVDAKSSSICQGDFLVSDGKSVYLTSGTNPVRFDLKTGQFQPMPTVVTDAKRGWTRLADNTGFLQGKPSRLSDSSWRWLAGATRDRKGYRYTNYGGARGHLLAFNSSFVGAYEVQTDNWGGGDFQGSTLKAAALDAKGFVDKKADAWSLGDERQKGGAKRIPKEVRYGAMILTGETLLIAGQKDAFDAKKGGMIHILSSVDGKEQNTIALPSAPVYEGLAAADGKLFVALQNGMVICLGGLTKRMENQDQNLASQRRQGDDL